MDNRDGDEWDNLELWLWLAVIVFIILIVVIVIGVSSITDTPAAAAGDTAAKAVRDSGGTEKEAAMAAGKAAAKVLRDGGGTGKAVAVAAGKATAKVLRDSGSTKDEAAMAAARMATETMINSSGSQEDTIGVALQVAQQADASLDNEAAQKIIKETKTMIIEEGASLKADEAASLTLSKDGGAITEAAVAAGKAAVFHMFANGGTPASASAAGMLEVNKYISDSDDLKHAHSEIQALVEDETILGIVTDTEDRDKGLYIYACSCEYVESGDYFNCWPKSQKKKFPSICTWTKEWGYNRKGDPLDITNHRQYKYPL